MQKGKLPAFLKQYFWDVDFDQLNPEKSKMFIIKRVLDRGDVRVIKWLFKQYSKEDVSQLLLTSKDLSPLTSNFWADYLNIDKGKIPSLKNPSPRKVPKVLTSEYLISTVERVN